MRFEATKFLVSTVKILVVATKFLVSVTKSALLNLVALTKNLVAPSTKNFVLLTKNLVASTLIIFWLAKPKMRVSPTDNFDQPNQIAIWLSQASQRVGSAYKIPMSGLYLNQHFWELRVNCTPSARWFCDIEK